MCCHDDAALDAIRRPWGELYDIMHPAADVWLAVRRDNGDTLSAALPGELHDVIRADYLAQRVALPFTRPSLVGGARSGRGHLFLT